MTQAGMSPHEVLVTGTRNVGEYFANEDFGTVAPGKRADLVLLRANPLEDVGTDSIEGVMVAGRWLPAPRSTAAFRPSPMGTRSGAPVIGASVTCGRPGDPAAAGREDGDASRSSAST
jgi:adenine deaminase